MCDFIFEKQPASSFADAYLLGNGRCGATVWSTVPTEVITLNHDTLWSGWERTFENKGYYDNLMLAREFILSGREKDANNLIDETMYGAWSEAYQPLGRLFITVGQRSNDRNMSLRQALWGNPQIQEYKRSLCLDSAVCMASYMQGGIWYYREAFYSYPDNALFVRFSSDNKKLSCAVGIDSLLMHQTTVGSNELVLSGTAPDHVEPDYTAVKPAVVYGSHNESQAIRFAAVAKVLDTDGTITSDSSRLYVNDATQVVFALALDTNYRGYLVRRNNSERVLVESIQKNLEHCLTKSWAKLKERHTVDYQSLYRRSELRLGDGITQSLPTSERLEISSSRILDPSISATALNYAKYLAISGSRSGTEAMNLQGIWNQEVIPPWSSNYTTNINLQMNYWALGALNLSECVEPLKRLVIELCDSGSKTAKALYRAPGWVLHHNTDLWRTSVPACEDASFSWWPMAGAWLCGQLFSHYRLNSDLNYLREIWPVLRGAAEFFLSQLVENEDGRLFTVPSTSPENRFVIEGANFGKYLRSIAPGNRFADPPPETCAVSKSCAMDISLLRELFGNLIHAAQALDIDDEILDATENALLRLVSYGVGQNGCLMEWGEDYEECTPGMGHLSHLYGIYPGDDLIIGQDLKVYEAAKKAFFRRMMHGSMSGGWSAAWGIAIAARMFLPEVCSELNRRVAKGLGANFLTASNHQIDAVLGWAAGIVEMLLQSNTGSIHILPALPSGWLKGQFSGFCANGGFVVSAQWESSRLVKSSIFSKQGGVCHVIAGGLVRVVNPVGLVTAIASSNAASWETKEGETYTLEF